MNDLHLATSPTQDPRVFDTCWQTGLVQCGRVRVTVPNLTDGRTAAELAAAQYLLTVKHVCGHDKAGAGLRLYVSAPGICDLSKACSDKKFLIPYANFLRTRFLGAEIRHVAPPYRWAGERCDAHVDHIEIDEPDMTVLDVQGIGAVELTAHAVEKYVQRFERKPEKAWRELSRIASEVQRVELVGRSIFSDIKHRRPARYVLDPKRNVLLVITDPDRLGGRPRLVTIVKPTPNTRIVETRRSLSTG